MNAARRKQSQEKVGLQLISYRVSKQRVRRDRSNQNLMRLEFSGSEWHSLVTSSLWCQIVVANWIGLDFSMWLIERKADNTGSRSWWEWSRDLFRTCFMRFSRQLHLRNVSFIEVWSELIILRQAARNAPRLWFDPASQSSTLVGFSTSPVIAGT